MAKEALQGRVETIAQESLDAFSIISDKAQAEADDSSIQKSE